MTTMSTDSLAPDIVVPDLGEFPRLAGEALDEGSAEARRYFESRKRDDVEGPLASMITRSVAKERLRTHGLIGEEFEVVDVALLGLRLLVKGMKHQYRIAIWKSPDDRIPGPGHSRGRQFFIERNQLPLFGNINCDDLEINLALVWNASPSYYLTDLFLHMPIGTADTVFQPAESRWSCRVPLPAELLAKAPSDDSQPRDLPYSRADAEEDKAEEG